MPLRICHTTRFTYDSPAYQSHNEVRMRPMDGGQQQCLEFALEVSPSASVLEYRDYYGNEVCSFSVHSQHEALIITARSLVNCAGQEQGPWSSMSFEEFLAGDNARTQAQYDFLGPSPHVPFSERMRKFFWITRPRRTDDVGAYVQQVVAFVRDQFSYEPGVTHAHSTVDEILSVGAGVCQDFAHLTIAILRLAGVPSRYVSGYLAPMPGTSQTGEQASHAWIEAQLPSQGWIGFDPTHGCSTDARHIKVAIGRDYSDVTPLRGVYRSLGSKQAMAVELKIEGETAGQQQSQSQSGCSQQ
jgi:transglutaminase-like putative cysteine protease